MITKLIKSLVLATLLLKQRKGEVRLAASEVCPYGQVKLPLAVKFAPCGASDKNKKPLSVFSDSGKIYVF